MSQLESANAESLAQLLEEMQESRTDDLMSAMLDGSIQSRTAELVRENLQRCKVIKEQTELVGQELKQFVKHQSFVEELLQKYHNRRPIRKKNLLGPCKDEFK